MEWIRLFNPQELQRLIGGEGGRAIDVEDLRRNTRYAGGYHESQPVMQVRPIVVLGTHTNRDDFAPHVHYTSSIISVFLTMMRHVLTRLAGCSGSGKRSSPSIQRSRGSSSNS